MLHLAALLLAAVSAAAPITPYNIRCLQRTDDGQIAQTLNVKTTKFSLERTKDGDLVTFYEDGKPVEHIVGRNEICGATSPDEAEDGLTL